MIKKRFKVKKSNKHRTWLCIGESLKGRKFDIPKCIHSIENQEFQIRIDYYQEFHGWILLNLEMDVFDIYLPDNYGLYC